MPRAVLSTPILKRFLILATFVAVSIYLEPACVLAQRPGGHVAGPGHVSPPARVPIPHVALPPVSRSPAFPARPISGLGTPDFGFRTGPIFFPHRRAFFLREAFFGFGAELWLQSYWLTDCGSLWTWEFGCYNLPAYPNSYGTYLVPQPYPAPVYVYGEERHDQVQLFMKDGTIYNVTDYWFVGDQLHFTMLQELPDGGFRNVERVISVDQLDLTTTIDVNTRRGFRLVKRDEPWRKYLQDHPDSNPPSLTLPGN